MPVFQIEMLWDCAVCHAKLNRGLERHCRNCGHPKDDHDPEYMPDNVTLADALEGDKKRRAEAGPDWKCKYCGSLQNPLNRCCTECGVPQGQGGKEWDAKQESATFDPFSGVKTDTDAKSVHVVPKLEDDPFKPEDATRPDAPASLRSSEIPNAGYREPARVIDTTPAPSSVDLDEELPRFRPSLRKRLKVGALVALGTLALSLVLWLLFRTKVVDVHVSAIAWKHSVKIERYQVWHHDGWYPEPGAFNVHDEGARIHHYDHVRVGSHDESYPERYACGQDCTTIRGSCSTTPVRCTSNKNGTANCSGGDRVCSPDRESCTTKYCTRTAHRTVDDYQDVPRYQDYYDWDVWDWGYNRTVVTSGSTTTETWPAAEALKPSSLRDGEREREGGRVAEHTVTFADEKGETWSISPETCQQFEGYPVGGSWRLKVGVAHGVEVLPPSR